MSPVLHPWQDGPDRVDDLAVLRGPSVGDVVGAVVQLLRELEKCDAPGTVLDVAQVGSVLGVRGRARRRDIGDLALHRGMYKMGYREEGRFGRAERPPDGRDSQVHDLKALTPM
ncbi:MAG: hypothetical protein ABJA86_05405 [Nocardioidaceae bacterium]